MRLGEINEWGPKYNITSEAQFTENLEKFAKLEVPIQALELQINTSISKALNGQDPEIVISLDDNKLN